MTTATAKVKNFRATPRKMRLLADFVRGKNVSKAISELKFTNKRHAKGMADVLSSAVANAGTDAQNLSVTEIQVQEGQKMRRHRAGSQGRALPMKKRMSHISVTVSDETAAEETPKTKKK